MNKSVTQRRDQVDRQSTMPLTKQCELLGIHRSGLYYSPCGETPLNLELMRLMDQRFMEKPWEGVPRMTKWLRMDNGYTINHKRIERLYKLMGLQTLGPKPNTSKPGKNHKVYPYLLRKLQVSRVNQVWAMDITYVPVNGGYLYLCAVIDLQSRYVAGWSLSNTMTAEWCRSVLEEAVERHGIPEILNTDQGSQFTSDEFTHYVVDTLQTRLSMDGKGRAIDNIFIERLWRTVKYEHVYLFPAQDGIECYQGLNEYFHYYNSDRRHSGIEDHFPESVYLKGKKLAA